MALPITMLLTRFFIGLAAIFDCSVFGLQFARRGEHNEGIFLPKIQKNWIFSEIDFLPKIAFSRGF